MSLYQKPLQSGARILELVQEKKLMPTQLTTHQRRICVQYMLHERKWTESEIADMLQVHRVTIARDKARIRTQDTWMLDNIDAGKLVVKVIQDAEVVSARLFRSSKYKDAWTVMKEMIELLQSLGYVKSKPSEVRGHLTLLEIVKLANSDGSPLTEQ